MSAMNTLGYFSEPTYITIGDPYAASEGACSATAHFRRSHTRAQTLLSASLAHACTAGGARVASPAHLAGRAGKGGKTAKLSRYYGKQFGFAPPKKGQVSPAAVCQLSWTLL
jgi:hypothetical protein